MFSVCQLGQHSTAAIGTKLKLFWLKLSDGTFAFGSMLVLGPGFQTGVQGSTGVLE